LFKTRDAITVKQTNKKALDSICDHCEFSTVSAQHKAHCAAIVTLNTFLGATGSVAILNRLKLFNENIRHFGPGRNSIPVLATAFNGAAIFGAPHGRSFSKSALTVTRDKRRFGITQKS